MGGVLKRAPAKLSACGVVAMVLLAAHGCAAQGEPATVGLVVATSRYACLNDLVKRYDARVTTDELTGVFSAYVGERRIAVAPGLSVAVVGARVLSLSEEVVARHGRVYVPRWLASEIDAYLRSRLPDSRPYPGPPPSGPEKVPEPTPKPRVVGRVCVDAGHGGKDPGASSRWGLVEKDVVLSTAVLLAGELKARGFDARLTRESDVFIELEDRPAVASRHGCDLFVAVHANAMRDASYRGLEIFYWYGPWSAASPAARREGVELAGAIRRACEREGLSVRNMRGADYKVLRYSRVPAALVEIGFLTNRADELALRTTAYRRRVAKAIADGIDAYRKGSK